MQTLTTYPAIRYADGWATAYPRLTRAEKAARDYNDMLRSLRTNAGTLTPRR